MLVKASPHVDLAMICSSRDMSNREDASCPMLFRRFGIAFLLTVRRRIGAVMFCKKC